MSVFMLLNRLTLKSIDYCEQYCDVIIIIIIL